MTPSTTAGHYSVHTLIDALVPKINKNVRLAAGTGTGCTSILVSSGQGFRPGYVPGTGVERPLASRIAGSRKVPRMIAGIHDGFDRSPVRT